MDDEPKMDQEIRMDDSNKNFHFFLHTFERDVPLNRLDNVKLCVQSNNLFMHDNSGKLELLNFKNEHELAENVIHNVKGFSKTCSDARGTYEFYVITDTWQLVKYQLTEETVQCVSTIDINSLFEGDEHVEAAEIIASFEDYVALCINNNLIVSITTKDNQFKKVAEVKLDAHQNAIKTFCVVGNTMAVIQHARVILLYSLIDGELTGQINIEYVKLDEDSIQKWAISFDTNKLIFVLQNGCLQIVDLVMQGRQNRLTGLQESSGSSDKSINTAKYGDKAWKDRVSNMHARQSYVSSIHKTQILSANQARARSTGSKKRVTGFKSKKTEVDDSRVMSINAPDGIEGYSVDDLCIDPTCISAVYTYNDVFILCQWVFKDQRWMKFRFKPHQRVLLSKIPSLPHIILTAQHLLCVITNSDMGQEEFVNELMVYGGGSLADKVCHINKWGRSTIPINTLDNGLKHRQIDTVSYFLKSKENFFSSSKTNQASPQSPTTDSLSWAPDYRHVDHLLQLEPAFNLLLQNVRDSIGDKHAQIFGRQVLDITMDFLYGLLLDGLGMAEKLSEPHEKEDLNKATEKLLMYIEEARSCVRQFEEKGRVSRTGSMSADSLSVTSLSAVSEDIVSYRGEPESCISEETEQEWDGMDIETVIEDGIMTNQIPTLQHYLQYRGDHSKRTFGHIKSAGLRFAVKYIQHDNMGKAKELLMKLGLNVQEKLWEIALHSLDTKLCASITNELLRMSVLTKQQVSIVTFLKELQELYPRRDFETLKGQHQHVKDSESHEVHRVKVLVNPQPVIDLTTECGNLSDHQQHTDHDTDDQQSKYYSEVMLQWIEDWDETTRDWIKLDVVLHNIGSDLSTFKLDVVWDYMQMYNMSKVMTAWIHKSFHDDSSQGTPSSKADWPVSHLGSIPEAFVDRTDLCTDVTRKQVLRAFAKNGIFNQEAHNDFEILLRHLNWAGGVLRKPHPLTQSTSINIERFHMNLILHCVQCNLADFLWIYCSLHRLSVGLLHQAGNMVETDSWLPVFTHFYAVSQERNEWKKAMLECSLMNAAMVWGQEVTGVGDLLQAGHVMTAMATLMYSPHQLHQVTFVTQQLEAFDGLCSETVERAVKMFPKLHVTLFPASTTDTSHTDVSVYQLLQGNSPFDPARLFGWQSTNTCKGEDASTEMPYFSNTNLVSQYGYVEHLKYTYYLKQGRPSFAYIIFLSNEFKNGGPTLSSKRYSVAMGTSMCIGVKHFNHPHISSSCVVFQELLGHDSLLLRTYIQVGNEILTYKNNAVTGPMEKRREQTKHNEGEVVDLLLSSLQSVRRFTPDVLQSLEAAILAGITKDRLLNTSFESAQRWIVAVLFCHLVRLPYTTVFLESCAQTNQWLPFIWFAQIHQYSKEQLLGLLHHFKSPHLQEHLRYVIVNASNRCTLEAQKKSTTKKRTEHSAKEVRMTLYTKIGLKDRDSDVSTTSDEEDHQVFPMQQEQGSDDDIEFQITYDSCPVDVFGVVFAAQSSKCPWKSMLVYSLTLRNPLFAELAACLRDAQTLHCLCCWLVSMMGVTEHAQFIENHGKLPWRYHLEHLDKIIDIYITNKWGSLLVTGFDIFQQNSPLLPFLQFYAEFTERKEFSKCRLYLNEFKQSFFQFHNEQPVKSSLVIGDSAWLERMTHKIIQYLLTNTASMYEVTELLKMLDSESITLVFKTEDPDYRRQFKLMQCIQTAEMRSVNIGNLLSSQEEECRQEYQRVISLLMDRQLFDEARQFAGIAGIPADHVTLAQMLSQKEMLSVSELWKSKQARMKFYKDCVEMANKYSVSSSEMTQFFLKETEQLDSASERSQLLEMCLMYMAEDAKGLENNEAWTDIYRQMWTNKVQEQLKIDETQRTNSTETDRWSSEQATKPMSDKKAKQELLCVGKMPSSTAQPKDLTAEETQALLNLIGDLLKEGKISECCRVTSIFDVYSQDLALTLTFIRLSLGVMTMETLTREILHLMRAPPGLVHRQSIMAPVALLRNSSTISLMSNIQPMIESVTEENEQKISTMEVLLNHCEHSKNTCIRILTAYKIALVLDMGYDEVVTGDDYVILGSLLKTSCTAKFRLAADFLGTSSLSAEEVAGFLSDAILRSFRISLGQTSGSHDLFFDPGENFSDFHQIIRLCKNPSILGQRLVDTIASMSVEVEDVTDKVLTLQTEVLILAHDCYTASCDMEGISNILRAARILTAHLEAAHEFQLMTRLLTGVGRYNEMIYIFDSLKQNHQFELLLGKGMDKESKLKTAILDYLKRYHPGDSETYTMVALKFMMYREIAQLLHDNANKILDKLNSKSLENNSETQSLLQKVAQYFAEAAESFIKDSCLRQAQTCVRRARLVALQLKNLSSNQQYINLTVKGANLLIADHPVFSEAYIISEAYHQREAWASALCNNVIIRGDMKYLQEFRSHIRIKPQLIEDAVEKYQQSPSKSPQATSNVKKLLPLCKDVKLQYKIAKSLGLKDIVTDLEKGDSKSYIMDFMSLQG